MPIISIPEVYRPVLDKIASMPESEVAALRDALSQVAVTLKPNTLAAQITARVRVPLSELDEVIQTLIGLNSARVNRDVSVDDFAKDVARSVSRRSNKPKEFDESAFAQRLISLLSYDSMAVSARAADIQHDYEKVFTSARIISDIRSVFGTSNVEIVGAMIVHNLKITYFQEGRIVESFFALDNADLVNLKKVLERAEAKTSQLETAINKAGIRYLESK